MAADCDLGPEPAVGRTATEIATALTSRDGLATSLQKTVTVGGLSGHQIDIVLRPGWTKPCPSADDDTPMVPLVGILDEKNLWNYNAALPGEQFRYLILDAPGRHNLLVSIYALEPERLEQVVIRRWRSRTTCASRPADATARRKRPAPPSHGAGRLDGERDLVLVRSRHDTMRGGTRIRAIRDRGRRTGGGTLGRARGEVDGGDAGSIGHGREESDGQRQKR
jgi:hypothetical protein